MKFEPFIGLRYLLSRKKHHLLSLITLISIAGVAVGVMALTVVLSVVSGFEQDFQKKILGNNAPLILFKSDGPIYEYDKVLQTIEGVEKVTAASPFIYAEVLAQSDSGKSAGVFVYGIDPKKIGGVTSLKADMVDGQIETLGVTEDGYPSIVVGKELAEHGLYLFSGATIDLISPYGEMSPFGYGPKVRRFKTTGIFKSGLYEYDSKSAYIDLAQAQKFFAQPGWIKERVRASRIRRKCERHQDLAGTLSRRLQKSRLPLRQTKKTVHDHQVHIGLSDRGALPREAVDRVLWITVPLGCFERFVRVIKNREVVDLVGIAAGTF